MYPGAKGVCVSRYRDTLREARFPIIFKSNHKNWVVSLYQPGTCFTHSFLLLFLNKGFQMTVFWPKFSLVVCSPCWFMGVRLLNFLSTTTYVLIIWTLMKLFHPWKSKCLLSFPKWSIICHQSIFVSQFGLKYEGVYSKHLMEVKERAARSLLLRDVCRCVSGVFKVVWCFQGSSTW